MIQKNKKFVVLALSSLFCFGACNNNNETPNAVSSIGSKSKTETTDFKAETTKCELARSGIARGLAVGIYSKVRYELTKGQLKKIESFFSSPDCHDLAIEVAYSGSFDIKEEIQKDVNKIDLKYTEVQIEPKSDAGVNSLNRFSMCSKGDWAVNAAVKLDQNHTRSWSCPVDTIPYNSFEIFTENGHSMYLGKADGKFDKSADDLRPLGLDYDAEYQVL